jgi:hypothetical protein
MEKINLKQPYRIVERKQKQYTSHYQIPADNCVVVPAKIYGDQIVCSVLWKNTNGETVTKNDLMIDLANLEPVNAMTHNDLYEMWEAFRIQ